MKDVKIKILRDNVKIPEYATSGSAAVDLSAAIEQPVTLMPRERRLIPTGIAISIPEDTVAIVCA